MDKQFIFWRKQLIRGLLFSLYAVVVDANSSIAAPNGKLEDWRFSPQSSQLEFSLSSSSRPEYFYLPQPPRLVVDLPSTKLGSVPTQENYTGAIQRIRISQLNDNVTRIVMDLAPGAFVDRDRVQLQPISSQYPTRWVLRPFIADNSNFSSPAYPSVGGELPPGAYSPLQPPTDPYYNQQPPGIQAPQTPGNLPPGMYNPSQAPFNTNAPSPFPAPLTLPPINNGSNGYLQPTVTVPPITNGISPLQNNILPPATLPPSGLNSLPSLFPAAPYIPPTNTPNNLINSPNSQIIEFGQPFPNPNQ